MPTIATTPTLTVAARKLLALEAEDRKLTRRINADYIRRATVRDEARRIRCALTEADAVAYQRGAFIRDGIERRS